jgi:diaminohydroxyphosphoribosylaminopyrimidine deaminase/5-amino-6-(5-phosphoribosylamino)uracil reductase
MVGCVIVDPSGQKIAEGYHHERGQPHAEVMALHLAGNLAEGATVYVTLEPCTHHGRTPPCADALIAAGVRRVVVAMTDPDFRVAGRGIDRLIASGIGVEVGVLEESARLLNRAYIHHRSTGMPWITVKIATTLDGKIATVDGDSRWITGPVTRKWVHRQLRDRTDAIMVGINTILKDDPKLTTRLVSRRGRSPLRVIVDSTLRTPLDSQVVQQAATDGLTLIACLPGLPSERIEALEARGVSVMPVPADNKGRVDLRQLALTLGTRDDIVSVLIEGGSSIIASAIEQNLVNRYISTVGPSLIGGFCAPGPIGGDGLACTMKAAVQVKQMKVRRSAEDLVIDALLSRH